MAVKYWYSATNQNFATTNWYTSPPTISGPVGTPTTIAAGDDAVFTQFSGTATVTIASGTTISSLVTTGFSGTLTGTANFTVSGGDANNDAYIIGTSTTYTFTGLLVFTGSGSYNVNFNGKTHGNAITFNNASGSWTLTGDVIITAGLTLTGNLNINANTTVGATFTFAVGAITVNNGANVTCNVFSSNNSNVRTLNMGSGTWSITGTGNAWLISSANMTFNAQQSKIVFTNTTATAITFTGGSLTYYTVEYARGGGGGTFTISGSNTFANFIDVTSTAAHILSFIAGTTTSFHRFNVRGSAGALITINRSGASNPILTKVGKGIVCYSDYITMGTVSGTPSNTWYIGANSTIGTSSGFIATNAPSSQSLLGIGGVG